MKLRTKRKNCMSLHSVCCRLKSFEW